MNKAELMTLLEQLGIRPGRGLGQNFLFDGNLLDFIVRTAGIQPGETILEVGPGLGALTRRLLAAGAEVYAAEFDSRICAYWRREIAAGTAEHLHLIEGDACRVDFARELPGPFRAVANLPYAASSVLIAHFLELEEPPAGMVFMLQKEMAQRLAAGVGVKNYGALSVRTQQLYEVNIARIVPPEVFFPPPEVESAVVTFRRKADIKPVAERRQLERMVKIAFAQRRKQLANVLGVLYGRDRIKELLQTLGLSPEARPENLSLEMWEKLTGTLN